MKNIGVKAVYDEKFVNKDTGERFGIFLTKDFCERVAVKEEYIKENINIGDVVRLDFVAIPYISKNGENTAFLACKVVGVC